MNRRAADEEPWVPNLPQGEGPQLDDDDAPATVSDPQSVDVPGGPVAASTSSALPVVDAVIARQPHE